MISKTIGFRVVHNIFRYTHISVVLLGALERFLFSVPYMELMLVYVSFILFGFGDDLDISHDGS